MKHASAVFQAHVHWPQVQSDISAALRPLQSLHAGTTSLERNQYGTCDNGLGRIERGTMWSSVVALRPQ
jgi:hypothetical protein